MRVICSVLFSALLAMAASRPPYVGLPDSAVLLEEEPLPVWAHPHRGLVLWVLAPADKPLERRTFLNESDTEYTCPDETLGHFYTAPTRVSLVDTESKHVLNTVPVRLGSADHYDIPFWIRSGFPYEVRSPLKRDSGKPHILALRDFNGDGKALEFAFYVMESCNGPLTMVWGYSQRQDRVIVYEFLIHSNLPGEQDTPRTWMYRFASRKPIGTLHWHYDDWYNSGQRLEYDFRYLPARENFEGTVLITGGNTNVQEKK